MLPRELWHEIIAVADMFTASALVRTCRDMRTLMPPIERYLSACGVNRPNVQWSELPNGLRHGRAYVTLGLRAVCFEYSYGSLMSMSRSANGQVAHAWLGSRYAKTSTDTRIKWSDDEGNRYVARIIDGEYTVIIEPDGTRRIVTKPAVNFRNALQVLTWYQSLYPDTAISVRANEYVGLGGITGSLIGQFLECCGRSISR